MIDWSINFAQIVTIIVPVLSLIGAGYVMREKLNMYIERVEALEKKLGQIVDILLAQARFEGKLSTMDERLLSQGKRIDTQGEKLDRHLEYHHTQVR